MAERPRGQLLSILRDQGPRTKAQLADAMGLSRTTLTTEVATLVDAGLLAPGPVAASSGGRRSTTVQLDPRVGFVAVSLGEARARVALLDGRLAVQQAVARDVREAEPESVEAWIAASAGELLDAAGPVRVHAAGLALATGPAVESHPVALRLAEVLGMPVAVESAVHAMALGEGQAGACRGLEHYVVVRLGAGATSATVVDGHLARGSGGLAGAFGHYKVDEFGPACTCGGSGCLDSFASGTALLDQAGVAAESGRSPVLAAAAARGRLSVADLVAAVSAGDPAAVQLARDAGRRVGQVIAAAVAFANPERVVLGGPLAALGPHLLAEVRSTVYRRAPTALASAVSVDLSSLGERAVLVGAAVSASDRAFA